MIVSLASLKFRPAIWIALVFIVVAQFGFANTAFSSQDRCNIGPEERMKQLRLRHDMPIGEDKPLPGCSGWDDYDSGYANLEISGVKFRIPRNYLDEAMEADGVTGRFAVRIAVPSFHPYRHSFPTDRLATAYISRYESGNFCFQDKCAPFYEVLFASYILHQGLERSASVRALESALKNIDKFRQTLLRFNNVDDDFFDFDREYFVEGKYYAAFSSMDADINRWFFCSLKFDFCATYVVYKKKIIVSFSALNVTPNEMKNYFGMLFDGFLAKAHRERNLGK